MDISKYRDNLELSDVCIIVEEHEFNLHKFPLSINSDYFKNEFKNQNKLNLPDFPGGQAIFEIIADHCYGKDVELNMENVISIFCASEYLGMIGKNNLIEKCQKYIDRIFRSAEYSRSIDSVIELLKTCEQYKSEKIKTIIDRGYGIIIQVWLRPLSGYKSNMKEKYLEDSIVFENILNLEISLIEMIIKCCSKDDSKFPYIAKLVVFYIQIKLLINGNKSEKENKTQSKKLNKKQSKRSSSSSFSSNNDIDELNDEGDNLNDSEKLRLKTKNQNQAEIFDRIINILPDDLNLGRNVTVEWLENAIEFCNNNECESKNKLLQLCGGMLTQVSIDEIKLMDRKNVTEIIEQTLNNNKVDKELMKWIWDHHFLEMAENSQLDPAVFNKVVKNMPESQDVDPDVVFKIVLSILNKTGSDGQKYKEDLLNSVNIEKISPENLEAAIESKFWNVEEICKVAIQRLKNKEKDILEKKYPFKDNRSIYDTTQLSFVDTNGYYGKETKFSSSFKSQSFTNHLNSLPNTFDDDIYTTSPDLHHNYYPITKYIHSSYSPESYITLEENLKCELKKISDSYTDYYKKRLRTRSRRTFTLANQYGI